MNLVSLLDVFIGLVEGIIPAKLREPMNAISEEIRGGVAVLDGEVERLRYENQDLRYELAGAKEKLTVARRELETMRDRRIADDGVITGLMRSLIQAGYISHSNDLIVATIREYYNNTNNKIGAIKHLRSITGMGLKESKDTVEAWIGQRVGER